MTRTFPRLAFRAADADIDVYAPRPVISADIKLAARANRISAMRADDLLSAPSTTAEGKKRALAELKHQLGQLPGLIKALERVQ